MAQPKFGRIFSSRIFSRLTPSLLLLVFFATLFCGASFAKFDHCRNANWKEPDSYVHACYSDIPLLLISRGLDKHQWSYSNGDHSVEYPVITGAIMWATSWITFIDRDPMRNYFDVNVLFISGLFLISLLLVRRIRPKFYYLLLLSPAVISSLFINWDLWGIVTMLLAIMFFDERRYSMSAIALGVSIATKFFPVLLLLPIALIFWRSSAIRIFIKYVATVVAVWTALNLPVILTTPSGWWHFYGLNLDRASDWGSIWHALSVFGIDLNHVNYLSVLTLIAVLSLVALLILEMAYAPTLAEVSFVVLAVTLCVGKVYSPQYVLWLVPLGVIAMRHNRQRGAFWIWQAGELMYHLAIWQHLASVQGAKFGLPETGYAIATVIRIGTTLIFVVAILKDLLRKPEIEDPNRAESRGRLTEFLFGTASSYP